MGATILVVEDNRDNMELMEYLLNAFGYTPLLASSGAEGIRLAREQRPDLILMDVQMPEMDGYEATAADQERGRDRRVHRSWPSRPSRWSATGSESCRRASTGTYRSRSLPRRS